MYCKECGTEILDGKFCSECGAPVNGVLNDNKQDKNGISNFGYLSSTDFNKWSQGVGTSLIIWGVINLLFAPYFGIMLLFFGILIYLIKSSNLIILFGSLWLLVALYQLYVGLFLIASYMLFAVVNGIFSIYLLYKVNKFKTG